MKKSILITGVSGSGKSTLGKRLKELGHSVHDIENIPEMFTVSDIRTGEILKEWDTNYLEQIMNLKFACNKEKLGILIADEVSEIAFYCGTATNVEEISPLFDSIILLQASPETVRHRLSTRTTHDFARTEEMQEWILEIKGPFEESLIRQGAIVVGANGDVDETADKVLTCVGVRI